MISTFPPLVWRTPRSGIIPIDIRKLMFYLRLCDTKIEGTKVHLTMFSAANRFRSIANGHLDETHPLSDLEN